MRRATSAVAFYSLLMAGCAVSGGVSGADSTTQAPPATPATTTSSTTTLAVTTTSSPPSTTSVTTTTSAPTTTVAPTTTTLPVDVDRLARSIVMVGFVGAAPDDAVLAHLAGGGRSVILFSGNIGTADQIRQLTSEIACAAARPVLIAVDQELSPFVRRLGSNLVTPLPNTQTVLSMTPSEIEAVAGQVADEMLALGINMNLAPVLDVVSGSNPVLETRHLGADADLVGSIGRAFMVSMADHGVIAVAKHFPGHGRSTTDPHDGVTTISASLEALQNADLLPFETVIDSGAQAVMVGHPIYTDLDPDSPASLSRVVLDLLRDTLEFSGVAISDSLTMEAVAAGRTPGEIAVAALAAGEDLLLVPAPEAVAPSVAAIVAAVHSGDIPLSRLKEASLRVEILAERAGAVSCGD